MGQNDDWIEGYKGFTYLVSIIVFALFLRYYKEILSLDNFLKNNFWAYISIVVLWIVILVTSGIAIYFIIRIIWKLLSYAFHSINYKIAHRHDEEKFIQKETNEIENLIDKKLPIDYNWLMEYTKKIQEKIKSCKFEDKLASFKSSLKKRLAKANELLEELEKEDKILEIHYRTKEAEEGLKAIEEKKKEKLRHEELRKWKIKRNLKVDDYFNPKYIFKKEKLSDKEIEVLLENGFKQVNDYCIYEKKFCQVLVKPTLHHSVVHTFLVWGAKKLLEDIKEVKNIEEHYTKDADITFKFHSKTYALEIETGNLLAKKNQLVGKLNYLNRKYPKRFMFIVSNRNLLAKYRKLGFSTPRNKVSENLRKLLEI